MNIKFYTLKFWKDIGYSLGSSIYLAQRLVNLAQIQNAKIILELWAGEWQVTEHILAWKSKDSRFVTVENDHDAFVKLTKKYGDTCEILEISAAHIDQIIEPGTVDIIISTLPLGSISDEGVNHILKAAHTCLKPGWKFVQYQYWMYNRKDIKRYFNIQNTYWEPRNIGPAFIYRAYKR